MMRDPSKIIDDLAAERGLSSPVPAYFPLGRDFCEACIREALAEFAREAAERNTTAPAPPARPGATA